MNNGGAQAASGVRASEQTAARGGWMSCDDVTMGTAIRVELWSDDQAAGSAAMAAVLDEMHRIDATMSTYKPESALSAINREAATRPVAVDRSLFDLIERSLDFSHRSNGAFDITYAAIGHLYDYRQRIRPTAAQIDAARDAVGYRLLELDRQAGTVRFTRPGMRIDLGGFAKGYAVDRSAAILRERGIAHAMVSAGGDSRLIGDRRGRPWTIGIRDPRQDGAVVAVLPLEDAAISTSGDYERYFDIDGVRYHHVLDPRTGKSPDQLRSVTIIAPDGLTTEGLSKSVFVLGLDRGMALVATYPGADAVVVDAAGALHYSAGLQPQAAAGH